MLDYGVTSELFRLLVAQGEIKPAAGTVGLGNEMAGSSRKATSRQVASAPVCGEEDRTRRHSQARGGNRAGLRLVWDNPNMSKATGRNTSRVVLEIVGA